MHVVYYVKIFNETVRIFFNSPQGAKVEIDAVAITNKLVDE